MTDADTEAGRGEGRRPSLRNIEHQIEMKEYARDYLITLRLEEARWLARRLRQSDPGGRCTCPDDLGCEDCVNPNCPIHPAAPTDEVPEGPVDPDLLEGVPREPVTNLAERIEDAVIDKGPYDGRLTLTVAEAAWIYDRLRTAPEGRDLPPPWGEGVEVDAEDKRAFGRLLEDALEPVPPPVEEGERGEHPVEGCTCRSCDPRGYYRGDTDD